MANLQKIYADLDLGFNSKPVTGDVYLNYDDQAVINSVRNLLLTNHYERLFQPDVGSNLNAFLFENISPMMESSISREIEDVIKNYEPRAKLEEVLVQVTPDQNAYSVNLSFYIANNTQPTALNFILERSR